MFIKIVSVQVRKVFSRKESYVNITITHNEITKNLLGLVDTGNNLVEPVTNSHVIICEFEVIKEFLPNELRLLFYEKKENNLELLMNAIENTDLLSKIKFIPFSSLGNEQGLLIGFSADTVEIKWDNRKNIIDKLIIGICNFQLDSKLAYQALINPELLISK